MKTRHLEGTEDLNPDKIYEPQIRYAKTRQAIVLFALGESWLDNFSFTCFWFQINGSFSTIEDDGSALNLAFWSTSRLSWWPYKTLSYQLRGGRAKWCKTKNFTRKALFSILPLFKVNRLFFKFANSETKDTRRCRLVVQRVLTSFLTKLTS